MSANSVTADVRTRFAPSPTGYLHIGGARTALYSWACARQRGGDFILRIEDTDPERSTREACQAITDSLDWLGLGYDGPHYQSENAGRHRELASRLLDEGQAYRCYMTPDELDSLRSEMIARKEKPRYDRRWRDSSDVPTKGVDPVIRFKMPLEGVTVIRDLVRGDISIDNAEQDDPVILRADGSPTYNFACGVDDMDMGITHVVRGEDHISNTPKQIHVIKALGGTVPQYAHLPLILAQAVDGHGAFVTDESGNPRYERMSKRNGAVDVMQYRRDGFLPEGVINYLACLGWAPGEREIFDMGEFAERFRIEDVNLAAARFDSGKLRWVNNQHMRRIGPSRLAAMTSVPVSEDVIAMFFERAHTLHELEAESRYFRERPPQVDIRFANESVREVFVSFVNSLNEVSSWDSSSVKALIKRSAKEGGIGFKEIGMPLRLALTGSRETPDISEVAGILGREESLARLQACGFPACSESD